MSSQGRLTYKQYVLTREHELRSDWHQRLFTVVGIKHFYTITTQYHTTKPADSPPAVSVQDAVSAHLMASGRGRMGTLLRITWFRARVRSGGPANNTHHSQRAIVLRLAMLSSYSTNYLNRGNSEDNSG